MNEFLFWFFDLLIPFIMILMGIIFKYKTPKYPEKGLALYGYRTTRSMKTKDDWEYAHQVCGDIFPKIGIIVAIIIMVSKLALPINMEILSLFNLVISFVGYGMCIVKVEKILKQGR